MIWWRNHFKKYIFSLNLRSIWWKLSQIVDFFLLNGKHNLINWYERLSFFNHSNLNSKQSLKTWMIFQRRLLYTTTVHTKRRLRTVLNSIPHFTLRQIFSEFHVSWRSIPSLWSSLIQLAEPKPGRNVCMYVVNRLSVK